MVPVYLIPRCPPRYPAIASRAPAADPSTPIGRGSGGPRCHRVGTAGGLHRADKPLSAAARGGPMLVGRARRPLGSSGALVPTDQRRTTMRRPTRTTLRALRTSVMLARPSDASTLPALLRRLTSKEEGMATAEYAIGTLAAMRDQGRICRQKRPLALCCTGRTKSSVSPSRADRLGGMSEWPGQPRRSGNFGDHTASPRRSPQRLHPAGRFRNDGVGRAGRDGSTEAGWQSGLVLRDGGVNVPQ